MKFPAAAENNKFFTVTTIAVIVALLAAIIEALYAPLTKLVSADAGILMSVSLIFFGGGCGSLLVLLFGRKSKAIFDPARHLRKKDAGKIIGIILLSTIAISLELMGFQQETATTSSILQNIITVATVIFAAFLLKEKISKRLGIGVALIVLGSLALAVTNMDTLSFSTGSALIIAGCLLFGIIYTMMKILSERNPIESIIIRGFGVGILALILALITGESLPSLPHAIGLMAVGFLSCGLSPMLLMYAQRYLGAAKAGAIYGVYPLIGVLFSIPLLGEAPTAAFLAALILFIPGMYFVITKNSSAPAAKTEDADDPNEGDTSFLASIKEFRKNELKNHVTSFGLLVISLFFIMTALDAFIPGTVATADYGVFSSFYLPGAILGLFILFCGVILLVLGKRVMAAVTFILMAPQMISTAVAGELILLNVLSGCIAIVFAFILLTSKDPQKYAFSIVNLLFGVASIVSIFDNAFFGLLLAAASVFIIWLSIVCGTGRLQYSVSKYLARDGDMTFRRCGSVIGYLLLAKTLILVLVIEYNDPSFFGVPDALGMVGVIHVCMLILLGLLLLIIGKRRVTSTFFVGAALALALSMIVPTAFGYIPAILLLVLGIQNVLRRDPRIMPSFMLIGGAFSTMLLCNVVDFPEVKTAMLILTAMCTVIALYLSVAVFSEKPKLPLF